MNKYVFIIFIITIKNLFCQLNNVNDAEGMMKKTKVLACIALTKARFQQDSVKNKK